MSDAAGSLRQPASERIDFRVCRNGDESEIVQLLDLPFDDELATEHWRWKFRHWPTDVANVWLGVADQQLAFHFGGMPVRFCVDGSICTAMVAVDVMTAPRFRREGVLTRGIGLAFENWKANGVAFTFGLPNERWGSRKEAAGLQELFPLQWLVRPLRPERIAARRFDMPWLRHAGVISSLWRRLPRKQLRRDASIEFESIEKADGRFDTLWKRCAANAAFSTVRDSAWVQWRFLSSPTRDYDLVLAHRGNDAVGYYASRIDETAGKKSAFLAEFVGIDNDASIRESILAEVISKTDDAGADLLATLAVPGTKVYELLRRAGFMRGPAFTVYMVPFAQDLPMERLRNPQNWNLSGADFDVV